MLVEDERRSVAVSFSGRVSIVGLFDGDEPKRDSTLPINQLKKNKKDCVHKVYNALSFRGRRVTAG